MSLVLLMLLYVASEIKGTASLEVTLRPHLASVIEEHSINLTCSNNGGINGSSFWSNSSGIAQTPIYYSQQNCTPLGFLLNRSAFSVYCFDNGSFVLQLNNVDRSQNDLRWTCAYRNKNGTRVKSNNVTVYVQVPLTNVYVYRPQETYLKENSPYVFKCNTSACRPQPNVNWYLFNPKDYGRVNLTGNSSQTTTKNSDGLYSTESLLHLVTNRNIDEWMMYCEAWAISADSSLPSKEIGLNVSYPPDSAPVIDGYESGKIYRFIELDHISFTCSVTGGNPLATLNWNCSSTKTTSLTLENKTVVSYVTLRVQRYQTFCSCESYHIVYGKRATNITLDVLYPPTKPQFVIRATNVSRVINIIRNNSLNVTCVSRSKPSPTYTWTGVDIPNKMEQTLIVSTSNINNERQYRCTAANKMVRSDNTSIITNNSSSVTVKVLYPPGQPIFRYGDAGGHAIKNDSIDVVKGTTFSIYCNANGYPSPDIVWGNLTTGHLLNIPSITSNAIRTCTATNRMNETVGKSLVGSTSSTLSLIVLYPPAVPTITVSTKNDKVTSSGHVDIIETATIEVECSTNSRPKPSYKWIINARNALQRNILKLTNINRTDAGNYTCHANNVMNRTVGEAVAGTNSSSTLINVLYPGEVGPLSDTSLKETSILNITCPVIPGNPSTTQIFWTRKGDNKRWNGTQLIITNVSRADDTDYMCTVSSEMNPTVGTVTKMEKSGQFSLNIFFSSEIKTFSGSGKDSTYHLKYAIMVNETEDISFNCTAEANPASDITITSPQNQLIAEESNKNSLSHTLQSTSYVNAGEYMCTCKNNYTNDNAASLKLILIVRRPPILSSDNTNNGKIATFLHADITLQFTARDYLDEPNKTTFIWFKEKNVTLKDDNKFVNSSTGLQSNLTIKNITQTDFGNYSVHVSNTAGQYIHMYELLARDKPEAPKNFAYRNDSLTVSTVLLHWMPGFNGGFPQTFILLYKEITETEWQNTSITDTGDKEMNYTLFGLHSLTGYIVKTFARNAEGFSAYTESIQFTTKAQVYTPIESHYSSMVGIVAGTMSSLLIILIITGIIIGVFINRKRKKKETGRVYQNVPFSGVHITPQRNRRSLHKEETFFEGLQEVDDVPIITNEKTEYCNSPDVIEKIDRIKVTELFSFVSGRSEESFEADYQKLPTELQKPCRFARKPENIALNRYNGIYPYDHSRVKVHGDPDFFINACYINGFQSSNAYIASLGPTAKTTNEFQTFWKMVWSEQVDVIVMLTNLREASGMKCEKYWPEGGATIWYGDVCVSNETTECFAEYTIRQFSVTKEEERRSLTHLHYTAWPDKTVPEDVTSLIEFRQRMKNTPTSSEGPVIVHCSAGIGRTGTLIALDRLIEEGQDKGSINVFECVENMREQRVKMVQTFEQYMYIYKALVNALTFDCETIPVETFNEYVDATNNNMYSMMFQQLRQSVETDSKADVEARWKNEKLTNKNRLGADIPGSRFRAMLYLNRTDEGSEYINAVYINSFVKRDNFIVAQSPLPCTVADFLTLVYQEDCSCIATMEDLKDPGMTVGQYLPDDKKTLTVGNFKVSSSGLETKHNYVVRKMKIKYSGKFDSGEKIIYHFQYTKWMTGHDTPMIAKEFVQFVNEVKEYANELGEERSHVIVHCLKANERSGLFCALANLMDKIKLERQVNVLNTVRHMRTRRQTAITSMEQLKFCFQATSEYIKMNMLG